MFGPYISSILFQFHPFSVPIYEHFSVVVSYCTEDGSYMVSELKVVIVNYFYSYTPQ